MNAWQDAGLPIDSTPAIDVPGLAERLRSGAVVLLDVREDDEWQAGHVEGSLHLPYHELRDGVPERIRAAAAEARLAVACSAGNRSSIAASLLKRAGIQDIDHVVDGGIRGLAHEGFELVRETDE
jgi:rhodanese-related sulfurtransferase